MTNITPTEVHKLALSLPESDRLTLAGLLLGSVEPPPETGVEEAWDEEITRRVSEIREGTVQGISSEEVFRRARNSVLR